MLQLKVCLFDYCHYHHYHCDIVANNFVGSMVQVTSMSVTVDTSPPIVSGVWIGEQLDHSLTSYHDVNISWDPIIDPESGLASIEWAMGMVTMVSNI